MKPLLLIPLAAALSLSTVVAQQDQGLPAFIKTVELGNVAVRYLDFKWDEEAFEALETGGDMPDAKRSWAIARLYPDEPVVWNGKRIYGGNLLILNPATDSTPMTFEVRVVDMRDVWVDPNVIAEPPAGQTVYSTPAKFEKVDELAERLELALSEKDGTIRLSVHYGDRLATLEFER